jgi:hypothetical protein
MIPDFERIDPELLAFFVLGLGALAALVFGYLRYRRYAALRGLRKRVGSVAYEMLTDILIPDGMDGYLHTDFLLLTQRGILVLELRETPGLIFGGDQMNEWTVLTRTRRYTFANPQGPLLDRVAAVRQFAGETPVEGRILFTARARFPKGRPKSALSLDSLQLEYAPVDKMAMQAVVAKFEPDWQKVRASAKPSDLKRY